MLFAWEIGLGLGHSQSIRRMAARLAPRGFRTVAAMRAVMAGAGFAEHGIELVQAPVWPEELVYTATGLAPILANFGVADPLKLRLVLQAWDTLLDGIRPDLLVADYAPGATLAARGRIPVVQCSDSFSLPPDSLTALPVLLKGLPGEIDQAAMLKTMNAVMADTGRAALTTLAELFSGAAQLPHTFPALDVYQTTRVSPAIGPLVTQRVEASRGRGSGRIFAYLNGNVARAPAVAEALRPHASRLGIFAPGAKGSALLADMAANGAVIYEDLHPITERLADAALFVSYGSGSVTAEALAAGVPQLALVHDLEKLMNGELMARAGVGKVAKVIGRDAEITPDEIGAMLADAALAERAAEQGEHNREFLRNDPLEAFEQACLGALG